MTEKVWFITGTSRSFGREWTIAALERGDKVAATARDVATLDDIVGKFGDALLPLRLDVTDRDTVLGIVPVGYADGVPRSASSAGPVCLGERTLTVAGRVCMDQFVVDLGPDFDGAEGDVVTLLGVGVAGEPTAQDWAVAAGTINYEIVTRMGPRLPRVVVGEA